MALESVVYKLYRLCSSVYGAQFEARILGVDIFIAFPRFYIQDTLLFEYCLS